MSASSTFTDLPVWRCRPGLKEPFGLSATVVAKRLGSAHMHPGVEIGLVRSGRGRLYLDARYHNLRPGDCYFLDATLPHGHDPAAGKTLTLAFAHLPLSAVQSLAPKPGDTRLLDPFLGTRQGLPPVVHGDKALQLLLRESAEASGRCSDLVSWTLLGAAVARLAAIAGPSRRDALAVSERANERIVAAMMHIEQHYDEQVSLASLSRACCLSPHYLSRQFTRVVGVSPVAYLTRVRIAHAASLLAQSDAPVSRIAGDCGFASVSHFQSTFRKATGQTPSAFRKGKK